MSAKLPFKCAPPPSVSRRTHWVLCHQSQEWGRDILTSSLSLPRGWAAWLPSWGSRKSGDKNDALRWSRKQPAWATETLVLGAQVSVAALSPLLTCVRLLRGAGGRTLLGGSTAGDMELDGSMTTGGHDPRQCCPSPSWGKVSSSLQSNLGLNI